METSIVKGSLRLHKNASASEIRNKRNHSYINELYCDDGNCKVFSQSIGSCNSDNNTLYKQLLVKNKYIKQLELQLKEMKIQLKVMKDKLNDKTKQFERYIEEHNSNVNNNKRKIENAKLHKQIHQIQNESNLHINEYITYIEELKRINEIVCKHNKELENENKTYITKIKALEEQNTKQSNIIQQMNKDCIVLQNKNKELIVNDSKMKININNICNMIKELYAKETIRVHNEEKFVEKFEQYFTNEHECLQTESNNNYDNIVIYNITSTK